MNRVTAFAASLAATAATFPYAPWAHSHFVWLDNSRSNQQNVSNYVQEYLAHNITVGGLDIDSGWSTGFNNFIIDTNKFPNMTELVNDMHGQGINVILWMTSMIDTDSSNYNYSYQQGYGIRNGFNETAVVSWWHGHGLFLDYGNPQALAWWNAQLDGVLATGIDGWKVDGTDPYISELITPISQAGPIQYRQYADWYYGLTFNHTRQVNGDHCLIWSRPVDSYPLILNLSAFLEFSPKYVMASGWVGDQDGSWSGLKDALINILESAWQGYANFGSDTGGYRSSSVRTGELLIRWAQVNAFLPLFENGGNDEHRPWAYDAPNSTYYADIYRKYVAAHYEIGPYLYATGTAALQAGTSSITPQSAPPADFPFFIEPDMLNDTAYGFSLGPSMFVSPIVEPNATQWQVTVPGGPSDIWYEYFNPNATHAGGEPFLFNAPLTTSPVFGKAGDIIPMHVSTHLAGHSYGDASWADAVTLTVHTPASNGRKSARLCFWPDLETQVSYTADRTTGWVHFDLPVFPRRFAVVLRNVDVDATAGVMFVPPGNATALFISRAPVPQRPSAEYKPMPQAWYQPLVSTSAPIAASKSSRFSGAANGAGSLPSWWYDPLEKVLVVQLDDTSTLMKTELALHGVRAAESL